jgi:hypothetical protein
LNGIPQRAPGDVPLESIAEDVHQAREAILATVQAEPDRAWRPGELMRAAKNHLRNTVVSIAFWNLVESGELVVDEHLVVRPVHLV